MTGTESDKDKEALKSWYQGLLKTVVREMIKLNAVAGTAVEAKPVWVSPYKILIAKVWEISQKSQFVWTISGEGAVTDYIKGSLAATPREAARHFSMKWQMDADRLLELAKNGTPVDDSRNHMGAYTKTLIGYAESLYDLASNEAIWKQKPQDK